MKYVLCATSVIALCLSSFAFEYPALLYSPGTGQKIPSRLVKLFMRSSFSSKTLDVDPKDLLYEIVGDDVLMGPGVNISLREVTLPINTDMSITYEVNGKKRSGPRTDVFMRKGLEFTAVYEVQSGKVISVWGGGIYLKALDEKKFNNIFVNIHDTLMLTTGQTSTSRIAQPHIKQKEISLTDDVAVRQSSTCGSGVTNNLEIAIAYDNTFCALHSNNEAIASAYVQAAVNEADFVFRRDTCVSLSLVHIEGHCQDSNDPYSSFSLFDLGSDATPALQILQRFQSLWEQSRSSVRRDLAYLFTGFEDGTNVAGIAYVAATCRPSMYGWVEEGDISTLVHEVGHSLSATHIDEGVMKASSAQGDPVFFAPESVAQITNFIDTYGINGSPVSNRDATCIGTSPPVCDSTCPGRCVEGQCITLFSEDVEEGIVPCTPVQLIYRCTITRYETFTFGSDCEEGFDFVLRSSPDIDVFCCLPAEETTVEGVITFEYPFRNLNLRFADGSVQVFPEYIQDASVISDQTLMKSTLLPNCRLPASDTPTPTSTPSMPPTSAPEPSQRVSWSPEPSREMSPSSIPSITVSSSSSPSMTVFPSSTSSVMVSPSSTPSVTGSPSSSPSMMVSPSSSPSMIVSPSNSPSIIASPPTRVTNSPSQSPPTEPSTPGTSPSPSNEILTCGSVFKMTRTFRCAKRGVVKEKSTIKNALMRLRVIQKSGKFVLSAKVGRRIKIVEMAGLLSTESVPSFNELGPLQTYSNGVSEATVEEDAFTMRLPTGKTTCCGNRIYARASLMVCETKNMSNCVLTGMLSGIAKMRCTRPCRNSKSGTVIPFSSTLECPTCLTF